MRITRREFMKYCATAAGALGLTTTDLMKLENALATPATSGGTQVVWLNGAACTGCTVSFANTAYYSSVQDLLVPWASVAVDAIRAPISYGFTQLVTTVDEGVLTDTGKDGLLDLVFIETLSSAVGSKALNAAKTALTGTYPYVLAIEGAIQTGSSGNFCKIGNGTTTGDTATIKFMDEVTEFATNANCLAILAVGTCSSFGGIPAAKGSITDARGLISTGTISGGYKKVCNTGLWDYLKATNDGTYGVKKLPVAINGSGYTVAPVVTITGTGTAATAVAQLNTAGGVQYVVVTYAGQYTNTSVSVSIAAPAVGTTATVVQPTVANGGLVANKVLSAGAWTTLMRKTVCVSGCPPHPDWIVGTIIYILTYGEPPLTDKWHRPYDYYQEYQCTNCVWKKNDPTDAVANTPSLDNNTEASRTKGQPANGNSPKLFKNKYDGQYEGCIGVMGCKGRKTKADCSFRRWNSYQLGTGGVSWCVQTRAGCHGCTEPRFPDGWGKFFSFK